ncbi:hypothetical protein PsorP6_004209 [Peronosclerospora sorghi]|uniref:Uncharacterized protein n=1 Tax=Peronosclerospora sorghi TaxID=230839 RepID=A0ACC0VL56_9STRA|nr:hypothetical protein PsorP6_004209 [Peronosclerospora sorghi]
MSGSNTNPLRGSTRTKNCCTTDHKVRALCVVCFFMYYIRPVKVNIPQIRCHIYSSVFIRHKKNTMGERLTVR